MSGAVKEVQEAASGALKTAPDLVWALRGGRGEGVSEVKPKSGGAWESGVPGLVNGGGLVDVGAGVDLDMRMGRRMVVTMGRPLVVTMGWMPPASLPGPWPGRC